MTLNPPNPPNPEQFGLTQKRINYFDKITGGKKGSIIILSTISNFLICLFIFCVLFPNTGIPFLLFMFLAIYPGFVTGGIIEEKIADNRIAKAKRLSDYPNYIIFTKASIDHKEALKGYNDLQRKIRRDDYRKRREQKKTR